MDVAGISVQITRFIGLENEFIYDIIINEFDYSIILDIISHMLETIDQHCQNDRFEMINNILI